MCCLLRRSSLTSGQVDTIVERLGEAVDAAVACRHEAAGADRA